jgi:hypothetical protein
MPIVKSNPVETPSAKKILKKKQSKEEVKSVKPVEKVVESVKKVKSTKKAEPKETVKESTKKSKKETAVKTEKEEKAPKAAKKINNKPTLADTCGLNLSLAKVKNIISAKINLDTTNASKDIQSLVIKVQPTEEGGKATSDYSKVKLSALSAETREYLDMCREELVDLERLEYSRTVTKKMSSDDLAEYNKAKRLASSEFIKAQKTTDLFSNDKFNLTEFNTKYNKKFYADMEDSSLDLTNLKGEALYEQCMYFINKRKIRFNSESKIFITAFIEYIIKQLVINGTKCCIDDKKKIIKLEHAIKDVLPEFTMAPFVMSTPSYKKYLDDKEREEEEEEDEEEEPKEDDDVAKANRKQQFKYYVSELCRNVRMELSAEDAKSSADIEDAPLSKFNQTSVSKVFKQFCSDVIIDLLHMFGNVLKVEIETRNVKTVNYLIISSLVQSSHMLHSLDFEETVQFIQDRYNIYNEYISKRAVQRAEEKSAKECA